MNYDYIHSIIRKVKLRNLIINISQLEDNKKNYNYIMPYILLLLWGILSLISLPFFNYKYILNGFVIFSFISKFLVAMAAFYFSYEFFVKKNTSRDLYKKLQTFTGYGVVITYVFFSLPRIVAEFYDRSGNISYIFADFFIVLILTMIPCSLYLFLKSDKTRLLLGTYDKAAIDYENRLKKDKVLRKKEQKRLRSERNFLQNLWYEWIDIILQAILIVMLINQFLFQMYAIPSESMVPTFLKKDMVVVNKLIYGPQIPLTEWKIPSPFKPKKGDIVVFLNPKTYDKNSDVKYKNIFARVFQPFLYRLTFTKVDIDLKDDGSPKERFIVKRMVAGENEKICLLNNKLYKKTKDTNWTAVEEIKGEKEWGQKDLYIEDIPGMDMQMINKDIRKILDKSEYLISSQKDEDLVKSITEEKQKLIKLSKEINISDFNKVVNNYIESNQSIFDRTKEIFFDTFIHLSSKIFVNQVGNDLDNYKQAYEIAIKEYKFAVFYRTLYELNKEISKTPSGDYFKDINEKINRSENDSPYVSCMKTANSLYKLNILKLTTLLLSDLSSGISYENISKTETMDILYNLSLYLDGIEYSSQYSSLDKPEYFSFFDRSNLSNFPENDEVYIKNNEYLLLGDNRYNSLDCRFGDEDKVISLDPDDEGIFSKKISVSWEPHTVEDKFIIGKALAIYFPFNRMRLFL